MTYRPRTILLSFILLVLFSSRLSAFDWPHQTNGELQRDMLTFAQQFAQETKGTRAGRMMRRFVRREQRRMANDTLCWMADTHRQVERLKHRYPPRPDADAQWQDIRRLTLQLLDYPLHVDNTNPVTPDIVCKSYETSRDRYLAAAREASLRQIQRKAPRPGELEVTKVYNMGFILRTSLHTLLIDIRWDGTPEEAARLAQDADAFLLTHPHRDHYSAAMLQAASDAGCPMVLPCELPAAESLSGKQVMWGGDYTVNDITLKALPGNQGENVPNNVYIIDMDGWRIIHQGDNYDRPQEAKIAETAAADLLIASSWNDVQHILSAAMAAPGADATHPLFIPSHENEVTEHGIRNRESYHELFARTDRLGNPDFHYPSYLLMDIGETIILRK